MQESDSVPPPIPHVHVVPFVALLFALPGIGSSIALLATLYSSLVPVAENYRPAAWELALGNFTFVSMVAGMSVWPIALVLTLVALILVLRCKKRQRADTIALWVSILALVLTFVMMGASYYVNCCSGLFG